MFIMKNECVPLMPWMPPMPFMPPKMWSNLCPRLFLSYLSFACYSNGSHGKPPCCVDGHSIGETWAKEVVRQATYSSTDPSCRYG